MVFTTQVQAQTSILTHEQQKYHLVAADQTLAAMCDTKFFKAKQFAPTCEFYQFQVVDFHSASPHTKHTDMFEEIYDTPDQMRL